ncbi:MAG: hypothetical protein EXX96DRAFT_590640 [Benjaminiella poitrasii]|nr:MAG: hypothetical protein EXX96DRAFT_590640 [Benjaminiella poitrasii]
MMEDLYDMYAITITEQQYEAPLLALYDFIKNPNMNDNAFTKKSINYTICDDRLYRFVGKEGRYVKIPHISERQAVLKEVHDGHGHFGQHTSWARLYHNY